MTEEQRRKNLCPPLRDFDVVLDTDAYNEIDDQYAIAYLLSHRECRIAALYAAPYNNNRVKDAGEGMLRSYEEIGHIVDLCGKPEYRKVTYPGSERFLTSQTEPVLSPAARDLCQKAAEHSPENPLYVMAIGAATNIASALLMDPCVRENTVVVWLGGHAAHYHDAREFNLMGDPLAAQVLFESGVPLVQLPCFGVVSEFLVSGAQLKEFLSGRNRLCDYLVSHTAETAESYAKGKPWSRVIWDVTAVAWLFNRNEEFMLSRLVPTPQIRDGQYRPRNDAPLMAYVYKIWRDPLFEDLFSRLADSV